jgi:aspartate aminotransferase
MTPRASLPPTAANMSMNEAVSEGSSDILNMSFGEAQLHPPFGWENVLREGGRHSRYGPVAGELTTRHAIADYFESRGWPTTPRQVVVGPGTKSLLVGLIYCTEGLIYLPSPSWLTYHSQATLLGRRTAAVPAVAGQGGVPDPGEFARAASRAAQAGERAGVLIVTRPDNPTSTIVDASSVAEVVEIAELYGIQIIVDEIYHELRFARDNVGSLSSATYGPDAVLLNGPSKSFSLGGLRAGFARMPDTTRGRELSHLLQAFASHTWSSVSQPSQAVLAWLYRDVARWDAYLDDAVCYYSECAGRVVDVLRSEGLSVPTPHGGFYVYPDFTGRVPGQILSASELQGALLGAGVAALAGTHFGDSSDQLTVRMSLTSLGRRGQPGPRTSEELRVHLDADLERLRTRIALVLR